VARLARRLDLGQRGALATPSPRPLCLPAPQAVVKALNAGLSSKQAAARSVGEEYESVLSTIERIRASVEDERASGEHEEARLAAEQARLLRDITAATRGATSRLEAEWERRRAEVTAAVEAQWRPRVGAVTGSAERLRSQLAGVASEARTMARDAAAGMAGAAATAFESHAAPLCRQLDAETARLGSRMAATSSARSRVRAAMDESRAAGPGAARRSARSLGRVIDAVAADSLTVDASDPVTGGAGAAFTAESRAQLAAVRDETLRHWEGLGPAGEDAMLGLSVVLASTAGAHEAPGTSAATVPALRRFNEAVRDESRRVMQA